MNGLAVDTEKKVVQLMRNISFLSVIQVWVKFGKKMTFFKSIKINM